MKLRQFGLWVGAAILGFSSLTTQAAVIDLYGYSLNINGTVSDIIDNYTPLDPVPAGVDVSGFDDITGLGSIGVTLTGIGSHTFDAFFDHEIDEAINTWYNESGMAVGAVAAGQSWEIDEPGYVFGDIYDNFADSTLDGSNAVPAGLEDDVAMAMGWDFVLGVGETALIDLVLSTTAPVSGFYLAHTDADSNASIYLSSSLTIRGGPSVPEPSIVLLMGLGLVGVAVSRRRIRKG